MPGDKSISHRALILSSMAVGRTRIEGLLAGEDVLHTASAMRALGAAIEQKEDGIWLVDGVGVGGLTEPDDILDFGNSGTAARLLLGAMAGQRLYAMATGDASLRARPMGRVAAPLRLMGAVIEGRDGDRLPMTIRGSADLVPVTYRLPVASAQVKSAILLAGLAAPGKTTVIEPALTRDHSERMIGHFGGTISVTDGTDGREISVLGEAELEAADIIVPGDPSSAAFIIVGGLITGSSELTIRGVGLNPHRIGLFTTLREMGAEIDVTETAEAAGEPVADITVRSSSLHGVTVPAARAPSMIDEYPILAVAAACAEGETRMCGLAELRVKESDRLSAMHRGLVECGVDCEILGDDLLVRGNAQRPKGGGKIATGMDHRIAMSFAVLGIASEESIAIDDDSMIATSFPGFFTLMTQLGADFRSAE